VRRAALAAIALLAACGGPRARLDRALHEGRTSEALAAYRTLAAADGDDLDLLASVARALLVEAACDAASSEAAVRELAAGGARGRAALDEVAGAGCAGSFAATVALARRGDEAALRYLRGRADDADAAVRAAAVIALSPSEDRAVLLRWAEAPEEAVRAAALERLGALGPDDPEALALLSAQARGAPSAALRARAVRALGSFGASAMEPLRARLSDPEASVRLAALGALARADREGARSTLLALLAAPTGAGSIEAARLLGTLIGGGEAPTEADRAAALGHLGAALGHADPQLRAQAAVALTGMPGEDGLTPALLDALAREADPTAALALARALLRRDERAAPALAALRGLLGAAGMTGVQAAAELAAREQAAGLEACRAFALGGLGEAGARAVAIDALGARHPGELVPLLSEADPAVRLPAAGAILAARR
jgi:HEAT repeat protein